MFRGFNCFFISNGFFFLLFVGRGIFRKLIFFLIDFVISFGGKI